MATLLAVIRAEGRARRGLPAAIAIAVLTLVIAALAACDPGYGVTIRNDTNVTLMLRPTSSIAEKSTRLDANQERKAVFLKDQGRDPILDITATDPEGRQLRVTRTRADLEAGDLIIVIRNEDFASLTPTAPK